MKLATKIRWCWLLIFGAALTAYAASPADKKEKEKPASRTVDSGSFTVFVNSRPVLIADRPRAIEVSPRSAITGLSHIQGRCDAHAQ